MEEDIKILEEFKKNGYSMLYIKYGDRNKTNLRLERAIENLLKEYRVKELQLHLLREETNSKIKELEEENEQLRIDITDNLCEECSQLAKQAGITEEDTRRILKDYRDKVENSIPISVIQNKIDEIQNYIDNSKYNDDWNVRRVYARKVLQELLEERNK